MSTAEQQQAIDEARKKFSEMYSNVKLGGKGIQNPTIKIYLIGSQKRKKFVQHKSAAVQDKKIVALAKKARNLLIDYYIINLSEKNKNNKFSNLLMFIFN